MNQLEVLEALKQINNLTSAILSNSDCITLKEYVESNYIPFQENAINTRDFKKLCGKVKIISKYEVVNLKLNEITENDVKNFFNLLKRDRNITQPTHNRYRSLLHHIFNTAIEDKIITTNPVKHVQKYQEKGRERVLSDIERQKLLNACKESQNQELYYIVLVALYTGMRYNNVVNMKKSKIIDNIYYLSGDETKSGKSQEIYLNNDLLEQLTIFINENDNGEFVFKNKYVIRSFRTACKKAEIHNIRFHDLRRTFATTLLENNVDIKTIQKMLGHSTIAMTEKYLASSAKKELDAVNKLCFM